MGYVYGKKVYQVTDVKIDFFVILRNVNGKWSLLGRLNDFQKCVELGFK